MDLATFRRPHCVSQSLVTPFQKDWFPASVSSTTWKGWCPGQPGVCELRTEVAVIKVTVSICYGQRLVGKKITPPTPVNTL